MTIANGLKVCTFNAKCDHADYKCCLKDACHRNNDLDTTKIPDSLIAALIAITILPSKADIYNIQNVENKCVVEHLLKEIARVKDIMDEVDTTCNSCDDLSCEYLLNVASKLNSFTGLCHDASTLKEALECCDIYGLDYVDNLTTCSNNDDNSGLITKVMKYKGVEEYNAYYNGSCLTLIKKSLCIVPETKEVPCVDSIVLFFEHNGKRFVGVNVNLGCIDESFEDAGHKKVKVDSLVCFLKQYEDCGAVLMSGAFGDFDYDVSQLIFRGDSALPEIAQKTLANGISLTPVPSDFPCDLCDPVYEVMEFLLKTCHGELVPYSWLLQYLRLKNCKKCSLFKPVCDDNKCNSGCQKVCHGVVANVDDCKKCPTTPNALVQCDGVFNRAGLRNKARRGEVFKNTPAKAHDSGEHNHKHVKNCDKPACVPAKKCHTEPKCVKVCEPNCKVPLKKCDCDDSRCEVKCKEPFVCKCDVSKHKVQVNTCKDLCKETKSCCGSCASGNGGCGDSSVVCPPDSCKDFKYCDTLTVLKRELCLYNSLDKVTDVNNRFTEFSDHFNRCLDCKFPKGIFQAWAQCQDYERPCKSSRVIDNNSELLALDHFLVSDSLKNNIINACLSDLCIEKCGQNVGCLISHEKHNLIQGNVWSGGAPSTEYPCGLTNVTLGGLNMGSLANGYTFQYGGSVVRSFFTHRVYCVNFDFPHVNKGCEVECGETLHGLGLTSLWASLCKPGSDMVDISVFEKFGLDRHPYFRDFFWNSINRRSWLGSNNIVGTLANRSGGDCANTIVGSSGDFGLDVSTDNALLSIQKTGSISEADFYKHLLCVFSNTDSRDRFLITIAFMEALFRANQFKNLLGPQICKLINDKDLIRQLFLFLSQCFSDFVKLISFIGANNAGNAPSIGDLISVPITELVNALNSFLKNNCILMEVLCRNAARSLNIGCSSACGFGTGTSNFINSVLTLLGIATDSTSAEAEAIRQILEELECGGDAMDAIHRIINVVDGDNILSLLMAIINGVPFTTP